MNIYLVVILCSLLGSWLLGILSDILSYRHMSDALPQEFVGVYDAEKYLESQKYARTTMRFSSLTESVSMILTIFFILVGGFNLFDLFVRSLGGGALGSGLIYIGGLALVSAVIKLPFDIYQTFVIESAFGFNKTTKLTFLTDRLKGLLLAVGLGGALLACILFFFEKTGDTAWLWCWGVTTIVSLGLTYVAPTWILPLFNTFTPLEEGTLRTALENYADKANFELEGIFVMDGSKRSTKSNAFFTGFGKRKRIALFDTLVQELSDDEIVAVLAHEVGHNKCGHITKRLLFGILNNGVIFYLMSVFIQSSDLFAAFGMEHMSTYAGLIFFTLLYSPVSLVLSILSGWVSRRHEFEADAFSARTTSNSHTMIDALKKLSATNLSNLTPHPLTVWLGYSHPPVLERIRALRDI